MNVIASIVHVVRAHCACGGDTGVDGCAARSRGISITSQTTAFTTAISPDATVEMPGSSTRSVSTRRRSPTSSLYA